MIERYEFLSPIEGIHFTCDVRWRCPNCHSEAIVRREKKDTAEGWSSIPFLLHQRQTWLCDHCGFEAAGHSFEQEMLNYRRRHLGGEEEDQRRSTAVARPITEGHRTAIQAAVIKERNARSQPMKGRRRSAEKESEITDIQWHSLQRYLDRFAREIDERSIIAFPLTGAAKEVTAAAFALKQALLSCRESGGDWADNFLVSDFGEKLNELASVGSNIPEWAGQEAEVVDALQHDLDEWWKAATSLPTAHNETGEKTAYEAYLEQVLPLVPGALTGSRSSTKRRRKGHRVQKERDAMRLSELSKALLKLRR